MYILYAHLSVRTYMYWLLLLNVNQTACVGNSFESVLFFPSPQSMLFPHLQLVFNWTDQHLCSSGDRCTNISINWPLSIKDNVRNENKSRQESVKIMNSSNELRRTTRNSEFRFGYPINNGSDRLALWLIIQNK